jgi:hypothetical protein
MIMKVEHNFLSLQFVQIYSCIVVRTHLFTYMECLQSLKGFQLKNPRLISSLLLLLN